MLKSGKGEGEEKDKGTSSQDLKLKQWVALQAKSRKITEEEFQQLATKKQEEVKDLLTRILSFRCRQGEEGGEEELQELTSSFNDASSWFAGGFKEVKGRHAENWQQVERKVESMMLFSVMVADMREGAGKEAEESLAALLEDPWKLAASGEDDERVEGLVRAREGLEKRRRRWGDVRANLESFRKLGLELEEEEVKSALRRTISESCMAAMMVVGAAREASTRSSEVAGEAEEDGEAVKGRSKQEKIPVRREEVKSAMKRLLDTCEYVGEEGMAQELAYPVMAACLGAEVKLVQDSYSRRRRRGEKGTEVLRDFEGSMRLFRTFEKLRSLCSGRRRGEKLGIPQQLSCYLEEVTDCLLRHILSEFDASSAASGQGEERQDKELIGWLVLGCNFMNAVMNLVGEMKDAKVSSTPLSSSLLRCFSSCCCKIAVCLLSVLSICLNPLVCASLLLMMIVIIIIALMLALARWQVEDLLASFMKLESRLSK